LNNPNAALLNGGSDQEFFPGFYNIHREALFQYFLFLCFITASSSSLILVFLRKALTRDSCESTVTMSLPGFEGGIFVAMSADKTFQYYRWIDLAEKGGLKTKQ